jgi:hypothetical protein
MLLAILTFVTAISISFIAAWYSIAGLIAVFSAAVMPVIIMGGALETGKIVATVWLHQNWSRAPRLFKWYLIPAITVLMFITSMGIFGFLSKAHIEQTSLSEEQVAQIESLESKLTRSEAKIVRWTDELTRLSKGEDVRVDNLVDRDNGALKEIREQVNKEKTNARADAEKQIQLQNDRLAQAADRKAVNVANAQARKTADIAAAQKRYENSFSKQGLDDAIDNAKKIELEATQQAKANELSVASAAQREIKSINAKLTETLNGIDTKYGSELQSVNTRIQKLRDQSNTKTVDIDGRVEELEKFVDNEQKSNDLIREEVFVFEKEYRKLEAEVGPIKYIAAFIYDQSPDQNLLEKAVRWVIVLLVVVFDPLALTLILASTKQFEWVRNKQKYGADTVIFKEVYVEQNLKTGAPDDVAELERSVDDKLRKKNG